MVNAQLIPITVIVPTKNEEIAIPSCLESLRDFGEVVVVDSASADNTQLVAANLGATVINYAWDGAYPKKKQWCLENVSTKFEWVLFVDADERPSEDMIVELRTLFVDDLSAVDAFDVPLDYHFAGGQLKHGHQVIKRALLRRGRVEFPPVDDLSALGMGEQEGHYQPRVMGDVGRLAFPLTHDDPDPFRTWIARHNRYSDWEAFLTLHPEAKIQVRGLRSRQGQLFDRVPGKPLAFFLYSYVLRGGWLDGRAGFDYAIALATYYWQISVKVREGAKEEK